MAKQRTSKRHDVKKVSNDPVGRADMAFGKDNYRWMLIGLIVIVIGFALMLGKTDDIYSSSEALRNASFSFSTHIKITLAPLVVLAGFVIEVYAIMRRPKSAE